MIKVITGIRRCGKSTLMELFQAELRLDGVPDSQIIAVNLEDFKLTGIKQSHQFLESCSSHVIIWAKLKPGNRERFLYAVRIRKIAVNILRSEAFLCQKTIKWLIFKIFKE